MLKADIDFEKETWDAANELRGAVSENNYKNYILPLVFLKVSVVLTKIRLVLLLYAR